jgi:hypothetical protein
MCVCVAVCLLHDFLTLSWFLSSKKVINGWQEMYLGDSESSLAICAPSVSPAPDFWGVDAGGGCVGGTDRWASVGDANMGDNNEGSNTAGVSANREWHHPYQGQTCVGGGGHC